MSYRRCSFCHERGHTKASCPTYIAHIERRRANYGDDDWHVKNYDAKKRKKAESAKNRKCSYCREGGHTRRTCAALKADIETTREILVEFRRNWLNRLVEEGLGNGALVAVDVWGERRLYFVRSMLTRDVVWWNKPTRPAIGVKRQDLRDAIQRPGWHENRLAWPSATRRAAERNHPDRDPSLYGLLGGPSESQIRAQFTDAWLNGQDGSVEAAFKWSSRKGGRGALPVKAEFDWHMRRSRDYLTEVR